MIGITSFGHPDCSLGHPTIFTRISHFSDWIESKVGELKPIGYENAVIIDVEGELEEEANNSALASITPYCKVTFLIAIAFMKALF